MKRRIEYSDLERHFIAPKTLGVKTHFHDVKRVPRKFKKRFKKEVIWKYMWRSKSLDLGQKLWYNLNIKNPDYVRFLIKKICES